jgi:predicted transcriptional regulator
MLAELRSGLVEIGLSEKEADVYLSMLALGPASVQDIAQKADVNRTTTYTTLELLKERGLVKVLENDKRVAFAPEHPERLRAFLEQELARVQTTKARVDAMLPNFLALFPIGDEGPKLEWLERRHAFDRLREEWKRAAEPVWNLCRLDDHAYTFFDREPERWQERIRFLRGRLLLLTATATSSLPLRSTDKEIRVLSTGASSWSGELFIIGSVVYFISHAGDGCGVIMKEPCFANMMRTFFDLTWTAAKPWQAVNFPRI